jgi:hypothetical protein
MARTGLTNFVVWALACFSLGFVVLVGEGPLILVAVASLAIALRTRFWPEGLGTAAGVATLLLYEGAAAAAVAIALATVAAWRLRVDGAPASPRRNGASTPRRLTFAALLAAFTVFVVNGFLLLVFGFTCQSDTSSATPGSDRAAWCDALGKHDLGLVVLFGPAALVLLAGIFAGSRGRAREVMITVIAGFALTIALHVPDFVLSNAAP